MRKHQDIPSSLKIIDQLMSLLGMFILIAVAASFAGLL